MAPADPRQDSPSLAPAAVLAALARAAAVGPFFTLPVEAAPEPGWYRHADLTDPAARTLLTAVLADYARRLPSTEQRVAASLLYQGYAALLWSPLLACARDGVLLDLDPTRLWLRCRPGTGLAARLSSPRGYALTTPSGLAAVATPLLAGMADALRRITPVPAKLLAGNAASALVGAARVLATHDPDWAPSADSLVAGVLRTDMLDNTLVRTRTGLRRTTCCLYYRVPGGGLCGDCALDRPPARTR